MDATKLQEKLGSLQGSLLDIDNNLQNQMAELEKLEEKWKVMDEEASSISKNSTQNVTLNVGGVEFQTSIQTLLNIKDNMFYKIVLSKTFDLNKEIYFDRSPKYFSYLLDFLRYKKLDTKNFSTDQQLEMLEEARYYEFADLIDIFSHKTKKIEFIGLEVNAHYSRSNVQVASGRLEDLSDRSQMNGICCVSPGWIIIELNNEWEFNEIEIGGYKGNTGAYAAENGANAKILTSLNKVTWNNVGTIPSGFGTSVKTVKLTSSSARYIKFESTGYLGLGFLEIKKA